MTKKNAPKPIKMETELDTVSESYEIYILYKGQHILTFWVHGHLITIDPFSQVPTKHTSVEIKRVSDGYDD
jgi:hypothetical protein